MKIHILIITILIFAFSIFAQNAQDDRTKIGHNRIYWGPDEKYADEILLDGIPYRIINRDGIYLAVVGINEGSYCSVRVFVGNNTDKRFNLLPEDSFLQVWKTRQEFMESKPAQVVLPSAPEKIANRIKNRAVWANVFSTLGASFATQNIIVRNNQTGRTATVTVPDTQKQQQTAINNERAAGAARSDAQQVLDAALRSNTVFPDQSVMGNIYFEVKKHEIDIFVIKVNGVEYAFVFEVKK